MFKANPTNPMPILKKHQLEYFFTLLFKALITYLSQIQFEAILRKFTYSTNRAHNKSKSPIEEDNFWANSHTEAKLIHGMPI